ncbi:MAG TPA: BrnT family toxin [Anaerolineae bacterium]|nr:BrnT family toxin [Anaerolineae bacterium]HMR65981.1 BrnT family toxin [Anaerolineae bacterium]
MRSIIYDCKGFQWDEGNSEKNWYLHQVADSECEQLFFNIPLILALDAKHAQQEPRYYALGRTDMDRWLFVAFTVRRDLIRVISARDMNQREAKKYAERIKRETDF